MLEPGVDAIVVERLDIPSCSFFTVKTVSSEILILSRMVTTASSEIVASPEIVLSEMETASSELFIVDWRKSQPIDSLQTIPVQLFEHWQVPSIAEHWPFPLQL
jgi:hypothetical protein